VGGIHWSALRRAQLVLPTVRVTESPVKRAHIAGAIVAGGDTVGEPLGLRQVALDAGQLFIAQISILAYGLGTNRLSGLDSDASFAKQGLRNG